MNLSEIRDLIRAEANIEGLGEYTSTIDNLINVELQRLTGKSKYAQLLTEYTFTSVADGTFQFDLPDNFQLFGTLSFVPYQNSLAYGTPYELSKGFEWGYLTQTMGCPKFWHRVGNSFRIYPYTDFYINDSLVLSYYKRPELLLDADVFPVDSLIPAVQQYVIARMLVMTDTKRAALTRQNANSAYLDTRSEDAGN